jgi:hypothetical protein
LRCIQEKRGQIVPRGRSRTRKGTQAVARKSGKDNISTAYTNWEDCLQKRAKMVATGDARSILYIVTYLVTEGLMLATSADEFV